MEDNSEDLWGPIKPGEWKDVLFTKGRIATEEDVKSGKAVFYLESEEVNEDRQPISIEIPSLVYYADEEKGEKKLVVLIQAETTGEQDLTGIRYFDGGNGVCMLYELEFIEKE